MWERGFNMKFIPFCEKTTDSHVWDGRSQCMKMFSVYFYTSLMKNSNSSGSNDFYCNPKIFAANSLWPYSSTALMCKNELTSIFDIELENSWKWILKNMYNSKYLLGCHPIVTNFSHKSKSYYVLEL